LKPDEIALYYQSERGSIGNCRWIGTASSTNGTGGTLKKTAPIVLLIVLLSAASSLTAVTNLSPAGVHDRLVAGDTLLLLDVREASEYRNGHIAEPAGRLPLTPASMPWNSGVLAEAYARLPGTVDIIVTCGSGGRSAAASAFLESVGFTRIYNMTGGFSSWTYERRAGGFGDHSGGWVHSADAVPVEIRCAPSDGSSGMIFSPGVFSGDDSVYVELHDATSAQGIPPGVPESDLKRVFRVTALDRFGLSLFTGDSLVLPKAASLGFSPEKPAGHDGSAVIGSGMSCFVPGAGWSALSGDFDGSSFHREETVLRKWYSVGGSASTAVSRRSGSVLEDVGVFPNPFNGSVRIAAPPGAAVSVYDGRGRLIEKPDSNRWIPDRTSGTGFYFIRIETEGGTVTKRVLYLK
jgi:rhodanese-related sulfurtransferase